MQQAMKNFGMEQAVFGKQKCINRVKKQMLKKSHLCV